MDRCKKCDGVDVCMISYQFHDVYQCANCGACFISRIDDCCRAPFTVIVKDERSHSLYFIRQQCINCGGCLNMNAPLSNKIHGSDIKGEFNKFRFDDWKASVHEEQVTLYKVKKVCDSTNSNYYKYLIYLLSDEWKAKRLQVLKRDNNLCQDCKVTPAVDVHHLTYIHLFNERLEDLLAICRTCHVKRHRLSP